MEQDLDNEKPDISQPYGHLQQLKMELLNRIHLAENPFDILYRMAELLEQDSGERGYAVYVKEQLRAVYGFALQEKKLLEDELQEVEERLARIEKAQQDPSFTEEEHIRIGFAIELHKKNIERLKLLIQRSS